MTLKKKHFIYILYWSFFYIGVLFYIRVWLIRGFPDGSDGKESAYSAGDWGLIPGSERFPWRKGWQPTPAFLPGEFHGQMSLAG